MFATSTGMRRSPLHGFTLMELLVTGAIISLLLAIALVGYARSRARARDTAVLSAMVDMTKAASACVAEGDGLNVPQTIQPGSDDLCKLTKWVDVSAIDPAWFYQNVAYDRGNGSFRITVAKGAGARAPAITCTEGGCTKNNW